MKSFDLLWEWLAWILSCGRSIHIGEDLIIRGPINFRLSNTLVHFLHVNGYYTLNQIVGVLWRVGEIMDGSKPLSWVCQVPLEKNGINI